MKLKAEYIEKQNFRVPLGHLMKSQKRIFFVTKIEKIKIPNNFKMNIKTTMQDKNIKIKKNLS